MSVIQKIRDKYARWSVIAIAVALLGFLLMDAFVGRSRGLFSNANSSTVGRVNGKKIDVTDFERKVKQQENYTQQQMQQQGYSQSGDAVRSQAVEQAWEQEVDRILMNSEIDKLGMQIGKRELNDVLFGANAPDDIRKAGTDPQTGQYNPAMAQQQVNSQKKKWTQEQRDQFNLYINDLEFVRLVDKYNSLLSNTVNFPRWFFEKQNTDNSQLAKISMVRKPYADIPDSSIKISDKEIADYISKHKEDYKQGESRSIAYVTFSAAPSATDSADAKNKLLALKEEFDTTKDVKQLLAREGITNYYPGYVGGKIIQIANKDSIFKTPVGHVYGPYLDGGSYVLAKMEGIKQIADTVKVRHILIATTQRNQQTGQMVEVRDTLTAKKLIDSIQTAIRNGSNFDSLCAKLSDDGGSKEKGGVYDNIPSGQMVPEFNDFIFGNPAGTKDIVKTEFGYHYIEILSQKGSSPGYKIAYLPQQILASTETDNNASNQANLFAGDSRDQKSYDANYEKNLKPKGIIKGLATDIGPMAADIQGLGASRTFVKEIYKAKQGDVLQPERIGDNYVVAVVTEINEEGTQSVAKARISVEPLLRNKKKAEQIKQKIGKPTTLEAAASVLGKQIETVDSLRMSGASVSPSFRNEPKITGAAFNPANRDKVVPEALDGTQGVYVIRVDNVTATAVANANVAEQRSRMYQQMKQYVENPRSPAYPANALKKAATITDRRATHY
jgi:peptidyl-prolyl cis-trans isomerase D